jgi:hypothetical protein
MGTKMVLRRSQYCRELKIKLALRERAKNWEHAGYIHVSVSSMGTDLVLCAEHKTTC